MDVLVVEVDDVRRSRARARRSSTHSSILPSSTLPTKWSSSVKPDRLGAVRLDRARSRAGAARRSPRGRRTCARPRRRSRSTRPATRPYSSSSHSGSRTPRAPRWTATAYACSAFGTRSAMSLDAVAVRRARSARPRGRRGSALVSTRRISPWREDVGGAVADARLRARVGMPREAERVLEVVRGLLRVPDPELDVVPALERHRVVRGHAAILAPAGSAAAGRRCPPPPPLEDDSEQDRHTARDLEPVQVLGEDQGGEDRGDERLRVGEQRRPRRADDRDRLEPEDVGQEERADDREREAGPDERAERRVVLVGDLRSC